MRRIITVFLLVMACFLLQCTVFKSLAFGGVAPNLLIILTSSFGFMRGEKTGLLLGFVCGLLYDICFGEIVGLQALILMYIGYLNGKFSGIFYPEDIKLPMALIVVSDLSFGLISYILMFLLRGRLHFSYYMRTVILPETVYTIIVTLLLYPVILKIDTKLEAREKKSAQKFI